MKYKTYDGGVIQVDARLKSMPNAQCGVRFDEHGGIEFMSYRTSVITIDPQGWLSCTGTYSATTRKHISTFMHEYGNGAGYYTAKKCYEDNAIYNIYTGEIISLADGE